MRRDIFADEAPRPSVSRRASFVTGGAVAGVLAIAISVAAAASNDSGDSASPLRSSSGKELSSIFTQIEAMEKRIAVLQLRNAQLQNEIAILVQPNGVIDQMTGHIRRLDGQGQALRMELVDLLQGPVPAPGDKLSLIAERAVVPDGGAARHQIVTRAAGIPPDVTPRMSDVPLPPRQTVPTEVAKSAEVDG